MKKLNQWIPYIFVLVMITVMFFGIVLGEKMVINPFDAATPAETTGDSGDEAITIFDGGEFSLNDYMVYIEEFPSDVTVDSVNSIKDVSVAAQSVWESVFLKSAYHENDILSAIEIYYDTETNCWLAVGCYEQAPIATGVVAGGEPHIIIRQDGVILALWHTQ